MQAPRLLFLGTPAGLMTEVIPNASVKLLFWISGHTKQRQGGADRSSNGLRAALASELGDLQGATELL